MTTLGLTERELRNAIQERMAALDEAQIDAEHLGPMSELMQMAAAVAYERAAELILLNNVRIEEQLRTLQILPSPATS